MFAVDGEDIGGEDSAPSINTTNGGTGKIVGQ